MRTLRAFTGARRLQSLFLMALLGAAQQGMGVLFQRFTCATAVMPTDSLEDLARTKPSPSGLGSSKPWKGFFERNFCKKSPEIDILGITIDELCGTCDET